MALGFHVRFRAHDDRVIAPSAVERRQVARTLVNVGARFGLISFNVADTHGHAEVLCDRKAAGEFARRVELSLGRALSVDCGFQTAWIGPIRDQHHLERTFWYILRQQAHHGLTNDPLHEASALPDLLGLRAIGASFGALVRERLPRTTREGLLEVLGVASLEGQLVGVEHLAVAAASAAAVPDLRGRSSDQVMARAAAVAVGLRMASPRALAEALGITPRTVRNLAHRQAPAPLQRAIERQLQLRAQIEVVPGFAAAPAGLYVVEGSRVEGAPTVL